MAAFSAASAPLASSVYGWCAGQFVSHAESALTDDGAGGDDADNDNVCAKCFGPGQLICCDQCPRAYHFSCVGVSSAAADAERWLCPPCQSAVRGGRKVRGGLSSVGGESGDAAGGQDNSDLRVVMTVASVKGL